VEALVRIRNLLLPALVGVLLTVSATAAQADTFKLILEDLTAPDSVTVYDGDTNDFVTAPDGILFVGNVGGFFVQVNGDAFPPSGMNLMNFIVQAPTDGGQFRATLSRTGLGPLWGSYRGIAEYGARFEEGTDADVTFQSWVDPNNSGVAGNGRQVFDPVVHTPESIGPLTVQSLPIDLSGEFSLVSTLDFSFNNGGSLTANTDLNVAPVPEPTTLLLLGPGMVGLAAIRRRLRAKRV
jgi:hypothetical protein